MKMNLEIFSQLCVSEQLCEMRWQNTRLFLIKCNFDIGTQQPTLTFPARAACLSVSQKSVVDMWQCLRLLTVNPALPHCVAALAGHITTFKLHTTVNSYGSHGGIVCLYLWWKFCSGFSSALHHFILRKVFTRVKVSPVCTSPLVAPAPDPDTRHQAAPAVSRLESLLVLVTNQTLLVAIGSVGCQPSQGWQTIDAFIYVIWIQQHFGLEKWL